MNQILLSYTAMDDLIRHPHTWLLKQMGIKKPVSPAMEAGKEAHRAIQGHCLGRLKDPRLSDLTWEFTKEEYHARKNHNEKYVLHGYCDMVDFKSKTICEIKTSTHPWSQQKFHDLIQWKYYSYVTGLPHVLFITCTKDLENLKTFYAEVTPEHIKEAEEFVAKAVAILDGGNLTADLVEGHCTGCSYRENCIYV